MTAASRVAARDRARRRARAGGQLSIPCSTMLTSAPFRALLPFVRPSSWSLRLKPRPRHSLNGRMFRDRLPHCRLTGSSASVSESASPMMAACV